VEFPDLADAGDGHGPRAGLSAGDRSEYGVGAQILVDLGVRDLRLLTDNPSQYGGLDGFELTITDRVPLLRPAGADDAATAAREV
jgi:3,4-dihydroxy 2-butanone 4-phosphate synthase/GTP cyclohydrolase II